MTTVGIKELKAHLSHYVHLARHGERVVITDRGRQVAELRHIAPPHPGLQELIDKGAVRWSGGRPEDSLQPVEVRGEPLSTTVLEHRR
jgi:antitoxin (DNA-binding transcriptional repressor) of toxin-antitoxin stability system